MITVSRIISILFAGAMCLGLAVAFCGIAFLIAHPVVIVLQNLFPKLRPYRPAPIYINLHRRHDTTDYSLIDRTPRTPVKPSTHSLEESGFYAGEPVETEKFPTVLPVAEPVGESFGLSDILHMTAPESIPNGTIKFLPAAMSIPAPPVRDPLIQIRKRTLARYLRKTHPALTATDDELIGDFLSSIRGVKRQRYL